MKRILISVGVILVGSVLSAVLESVTDVQLTGNPFFTAMFRLIDFVRGGVVFMIIFGDRFE